MPPYQEENLTVTQISSSKTRGSMMRQQGGHWIAWKTRIMSRKWSWINEEADVSSRKAESVARGNPKSRGVAALQGMLNVLV